LFLFGGRCRTFSFWGIGVFFSTYNWHIYITNVQYLSFHVRYEDGEVFVYFLPGLVSWLPAFF